MWSALVWIGKIAVDVILWAVNNPITAFLIGSAAVVAGGWISEQNFAGAETLGRMLGYFGGIIAGVGLGAWIGGVIIGYIPIVKWTHGMIAGPLGALAFGPWLAEHWGGFLWSIFGDDD